MTGPDPASPAAAAAASSPAAAASSPSGKLRLIFMGTPDFAVASLESLISDGQIVLAVVTAPDKPAGRGKEIHSSPVKIFAGEAGIDILQPENLKDPSFTEKLISLNPDLIIVVAFRMLPEIVWRMPRIGTVNLHASLLPQYRGAAPINWAIINGENKTGLTTFFINREIDTGEVLLQHEMDIFPEDDAGTLHDRLKDAGAMLLVNTVHLIASGNYTTRPQSAIIPPCRLRPAPKIAKEDCRINWTSPAAAIVNFIRGLSPYPTAWATLAGEGRMLPVKIFRAEAMADNHTLSSGTIVPDSRSILKVASGDGFVAIKELQLAGKRRLKAEEFLIGFPRIENYRFE